MTFVGLGLDSFGTAFALGSIEAELALSCIGADSPCSLGHTAGIVGIAGTVGLGLVTTVVGRPCLVGTVHSCLSCSSEDKNYQEHLRFVVLSFCRKMTSSAGQMQHATQLEVWCCRVAVAML